MAERQCKVCTKSFKTEQALHQHQEETSRHYKTTGKKSQQKLGTVRQQQQTLSDGKSQSTSNKAQRSSEEDLLPPVKAATPCHPPTHVMARRSRRGRGDHSRDKVPSTRPASSLNNSTTSDLVRFAFESSMMGADNPEALNDFAAALQNLELEENNGNNGMPEPASSASIAASPQVIEKMDDTGTETPPDEDVVEDLRPLVFLSPPEYPVANCRVGQKFVYGNQLYSDVIEKDNLFQALRLRRHDPDRLVSNKILTSENHSSWCEVRLPEGVYRQDFVLAPAPNPRRPTLRVLALDCEMVGVAVGRNSYNRERSELAQLCVVDVLTGNLVFDLLVLPAERVVNWRKRFSGLSYPAMMAARDQGRLLRSWKAARAELLRFMDTNTIIIGHSIQNDLHMLRLAHSNIIDTSIQTAEAVFGDKERFDRIWGLKDLAKALPEITIQTGRQGHDCREDTLATREIALWCVCYPVELANWASQMRAELQQKKNERDQLLAYERKLAKEHAAKKAALKAEEQQSAPVYAY
ncbi:hypothetical protein LQW54_000071 [Pestalotiopsis sp. IQ-011]